MIDYTAAAPDDPRSLLVLQDLHSMDWRIVLVGAWMTRVWLVAEDRPETIRRTNDIDLALVPELPAATDLIARLGSLNYVQDRQGYPFRYQRMSEDGLLIIDLLTDAERPQHADALRVVGLATAVRETVAFRLVHRARGVDLPVNVPTIERALLLRALALDAGPEMLKFVDYARDYAALAKAVVESHLGEFRELTPTKEYALARDLIGRLFHSIDAPGTRAVASAARGDPDVEARSVVRASNDLFGRGSDAERP